MSRPVSSRRLAGPEPRPVGQPAPAVIPILTLRFMKTPLSTQFFRILLGTCYPCCPFILLPIFPVAHIPLKAYRYN